MEWRKLHENYVLDGDGFYVSWLPSTRTFMGVPSKLFEGDDKGKGETALVNDSLPGEKYLILNGDYRKEYEEALPKGYAACRAVYEAHRAVAGSKWSSDVPGGKFVEKLIERFTDES